MRPFEFGLNFNLNTIQKTKVLIVFGFKR